MVFVLILTANYSKNTDNDDDEVEKEPSGHLTHGTNIHMHKRHSSRPSVRNGSERKK